MNIKSKSLEIANDIIENITNSKSLLWDSSSCEAKGDGNKATFEMSKELYYNDEPSPYYPPLGNITYIVTVEAKITEYDPED